MSPQDAETKKQDRRHFDNWPIANLHLRIAAAIVDQSLVLIGTVLFLITFFPNKTWTHEWWTMLFLSWPMLSFTTQCFFIYYTGTTPGKSAFGLKLQNAKPHTPLSQWQIISRQCFWWLGAASLGAGWCTVFTRNDRRAWHDMFSESLVVTSDPKNAIKSNVTALEKKLGHGWGIFVSIVLFSMLTTTVFLQFQKLGTPHALSQSSHSKAYISLEEASWLLFTEQYDQTLLEPETQDESRLAELLSQYTKSIKLSEAERPLFYQNKMQKIENTLCSENMGSSLSCNSAKIISALTQESKLKETLPQPSLPALQILYRLNLAKNVNEKTDILLEELVNLTPGSTPHMALKTYLLKTLILKGDFNSELAFEDLKSTIPENNKANELILSKFKEHSCQFTAFKICDTTSTPSCDSQGEWKHWNEGCLKKSPTSLKTLSAKLGYAWKKTQDSQLTEEEWKNLQVDLSSATEIEKQIALAIDFNLTLKHDAPTELLEKSKRMGQKNILWGWAQIQAMKEYGNQWLALITPAEQKQAANYALKENKVFRDIANTKKKKNR